MPTTLFSHPIDKCCRGARDWKEVRKNQARRRKAFTMSPNKCLSKSTQLGADKVCATWVGPGTLLRRLLLSVKMEQKGWEGGQETLSPAAYLYSGLTPIPVIFISNCLKMMLKSHNMRLVFSVSKHTVQRHEAQQCGLDPSGCTTNLRDSSVTHS